MALHKPLLINPKHKLNLHKISGLLSHAPGIFAGTLQGHSILPSLLHIRHTTCIARWKLSSQLQMVDLFFHDSLFSILNTKIKVPLEKPSLCPCPLQPPSALTQVYTPTDAAAVPLHISRRPQEWRPGRDSSRYAWHRSRYRH